MIVLICTSTHFNMLNSFIHLTLFMKAAVKKCDIAECIAILGFACLGVVEKCAVRELVKQLK